MHFHILLYLKKLSYQLFLTLIMQAFTVLACQQVA